MKNRPSPRQKTCKRPVTVRPFRLSLQFALYAQFISLDPPNDEEEEITQRLKERTVFITERRRVIHYV